MFDINKVEKSDDGAFVDRVKESIRGLFFKNDNGQSLVEYVMILSLISLVVVGSAAGLGDGVDKIFGDVSDNLADEALVTFVDEDDEYEVIGKIDHSLNEYAEGDVPELEKEGKRFDCWVTEDEEVFDMDTKINDEFLVVTAKWKDNDIITRTFEFSEEKDRDQLKSLELENLHEIVSLEADKGDVELIGQKNDKVELGLSNRPYDRRVQTGGKLTLADSKEVSGERTSDYNSGGYKGTLDRYLYSGSYTPADTKYVSGQSSSNYNSGGYSGSLSRYLSSGSYTAADSITETKNLTKYYSEHYYQANGRPIRDSFRSNRSSITGHTESATVTRNGRTYSGTLRYSGHSVNWSTPFDSPGRNFVGEYETLREQWNVRYSGTLTSPARDTRVYRYRGNVTKPAVDSRTYRYRGTVKRPYSDTRTWDNFYNYTVTIQYREK